MIVTVTLNPLAQSFLLISYQQFWSKLSRLSLIYEPISRYSSELNHKFTIYSGHMLIVHSIWMIICIIGIVRTEVHSFSFVSFDEEGMWSKWILESLSTYVCSRSVIKVTCVVLLAAGSFLLVSFSSWYSVTYLGVALASISSGLGEVCRYQLRTVALLSAPRPNRVQRKWADPIILRVWQSEEWGRL